MRGDQEKMDEKQNKEKRKRRKAKSKMFDDSGWAKVAMRRAR